MRGRRMIAAVVVAGAALLATVPTAIACSAPFEPPTIRALGPAQLVVVGRVGERVPGGRLFHVERWFNGGEPGTPIVIGFKEGEPIGDCSYPVATGEHKIIAPVREPDGTLYADLGTLQADPNTDDGRRYIAEAVALFGPGAVPQPPPATETTDPGPPLILVGGVAALGIALGVAVVLVRRRSAG